MAPQAPIPARCCGHPPTRAHTHSRFACAAARRRRWRTWRRSPRSGSSGSGAARKAPRVSGHGHGSAAAASAASHPSGHGSGTGIGAGEVALIAVLVLGGLALAAFLTRPLGPGESELAELERAFARAGRPLGRDTTLLGLERRLAASPDAARYVRALRVARFGEAAERPSKRARRALRAQLRMGLGP